MLLLAPLKCKADCYSDLTDIRQTRRRRRRRRSRQPLLLILSSNERPQPVLTPLRLHQESRLPRLLLPMPSAHHHLPIHFHNRYINQRILPRFSIDSWNKNHATWSHTLQHLPVLQLRLQSPTHNRYKKVQIPSLCNPLS